MRSRFWTAAGLIIWLGWGCPSWGASQGWPASLTIGTASPGGVYYSYGQELAAILTEALGIPVSGQATQGPDQNILLLESGDAPVGFVSMGVALQAWNGTGAWTHSERLRSMRALFPMYDTSFQFLAFQDSGYQSFADLANKRIGIGPQGGTGGSYLPTIFKTLQIPAALRIGAWDTMSSQMRAHLLDVVAATGGVPQPFIAGISTTAPVNLIALDDGEIATLRKTMPELGMTVVPAGAYPWLMADYKTIGMYNFGVARKDLPDDLVYAIVKAFYANHERLVQASPSARESVVDNVKRNEFLPYHPGAVRYYREIGVEIPAGLVLPE
jgi:TRAP transporter TAXI family solute receptor